MGLAGLYLLLMWKFMPLFPPGVQLACMLSILWVFFAACVKRFHDIDYSGWTALWFFVPPITLYFLYLVVAIKGSPGRNDYGPPPGKKEG